MKLRERQKTFTFDVFAGYRVHVIVTSSIPATCNRLEAAIGRLDNLQECGGLCASPSHLPGQSWIILPDNVRKAGGSGTIAHECFHCVWKLMTWAGAELENEVVAYHLGFLVGNVDYMLKGKSGKVKTYEKVT